MIRNAVRFFRDNWKSLVPMSVFIMLVSVTLMFVRVYVATLNIYLSPVVDIILGIGIYPVLTLGVAYYGVNLVKGYDGKFTDVFHWIGNRPINALVLGGCMYVINAAPTALRSLIGAQSLLGASISFILALIISIKFMLVPYIFTENIEWDTISTLKSSWRLSKGYEWPILKIFLMVSLASFVLFLLLGVVLYSAIYGIESVQYFATFTVFMSATFMTFITVISNYVVIFFAGLALDIFENEGEI